jgi:DNA excision repair protein ERCC-1
VEIGASATFSQAFASVEDTSHFQNELSNLKQGDNQNKLGESWVQQRAFDQAAAADENTAEMSDRDHHALMQPHVLYVSTKQRGNGILKHIRNVPFAFSKMVPDYIMNTSRCALFLSCRYHSLYPNYIHRRIAELKTDFILRVLLVFVDVEDNANTLAFLNKLAVVHNMTLILAWSEEEAARYLETYKAFDGKDASSIQRREQLLFADQVVDVLSSAKSVNKTDSAQLLSQFGSLKAVIAASMDELCLCPGMGEKKVRRLHDAFHKPFSSRQAKRRRVTKVAADAPDTGNADYEEKAAQAVLVAKGAPSDTASIEPLAKDTAEA